MGASGGTCRPFSKTVTYNLVKVLEKSKGRVELNADVELPEKEKPVVAPAEEESEEK